MRPREIGLRVLLWKNQLPQPAAGQSVGVPVAKRGIALDGDGAVWTPRQKCREPFLDSHRGCLRGPSLAREHACKLGGQTTKGRGPSSRDFLRL